MVLTKEDRIALLARAREAKAKKRVSVKEEETEDEEAEAVVNVPMPEIEAPTPKKKTGRKPRVVVPLPVPVEVIQVEEELPVPKKKGLPKKWLKPNTEPVRVCCDAKLTKEQPVIDDAPQIVAETIVVPPQKEIKKVRKIRASTPTRTLELTPPRDIEDVIEDLKKDNQKYLPKIRQSSAPPSAPIQIVRSEPALRLFDY